MATEFEDQLKESHDKLTDDDDFEIEDALEEEIEDDEDEEVAEDDSEEEVEEEVEEEGDDTPETAVDDGEEITPIHTWPQEYKDTFNGLPRAAQKNMLDMSRNMLRGFQQKMGQLGREERELGGFRQAVSQHKDRLQRAGIDPVTAASRALSWDAYIDEKGAQGLYDYAKAKGIDLSQAQQNPEQQEYLTPTERSMKEELTSLRQAFMGTQQEQQTRQQNWARHQQEAQSQQAARTLSDFMQEKGPDGKLLHPHMELVAGSMANQMNIGEARDLQQAYDIATSYHPEIRATRDRQRKVGQIKDGKRKVDRVRKASNAGPVAKSPDRSRSASGSANEFESQIASAHRKLTA